MSMNQKLSFAIVTEGGKVQNKPLVHEKDGGGTGLRFKINLSLDGLIDNSKYIVQ